MTQLTNPEAVGIEILEALSPATDEIASLVRKASSLRCALETYEETLSWLVCVYALKAVSLGNFGVGSVLVDASHNIVAAGHNEVFVPRFRSDAHAEMVVVNAFEAQYPDSRGLGGYTLYTSLESCPMCLTRLITAGIGNVLHVCDDETGGMVHRRSSLPSIWSELSAKRNFRQAHCPSRIEQLARSIFLTNAEYLNGRLVQRSSQT